jgi:nascent polypeptide-associated complex subunit alpha
MMKQMGMNMNEMGDIQRVILQGQNREIVIEGPQVTSIDVQGTTMYQVAGGTETERKLEAKEKEVQIPEEDILLVAQQANVSMEKARAALEQTEGDLAQAILNLQTR